MKLRTIIATATTAAVLATAGVALAGAASNTSTPSPPASTPPSAAAPATPRADAFAPRVTARRLGLRKMLRGAGDIVTKAIGIDRATLRADLRSGQTIAQIATANHVDPQVVIGALVAAAKSKLDAAVTAGQITAARAARIEGRLPARVTKLVNNWHPKGVRNATTS